MKKIKNKLTKSLSAILAFAILISGIIIPNKIVSAAPREIKVTNNGGGNYEGSDYFSSSDGYYIFCGEASLTPPVNPGETKTLTGWREENNEKVRKVAYYGYASPEKWSKLETFNLWGTPANKGTKGYHLTHYALSNVWRESPKYFESNSEMKEFMSFINKKPNAPDWFKVYSTKSGGSQRMFAWNFNKPKPNTMWLEVQKTNTEGKLLDKVEFHVWYKGKNDGEKGSVQNPWKYITYDSNSMYTKGDGKKQEAYHGKFVDNFSDTRYSHIVVKEIKTLDGYILDTKEQEVKLVLDGYTPTKEHLTGQGTSHVLKFVNHKKTPPKKQNLSLLKTSANKTLTDIAKAGYSLEGAEYGVYNSIVNANLNKNILGKLTTDESGKSNTLNLDKGKYFVKELKAPKGFGLDKQIYEVDLTSKDQVLNVKDEPLFDPLTIMLRKENESGKALEGAEFTVKFYNEILTSTKGKTPVRTWKFKTNEMGRFGLLDKYKIGGDDFYRDSNGMPVGLIGTYEFIETKAPKGYILDSTPVLAYVKEGEEGTIGTVYNMPIVKNESAEKELKLVKVDSETGKQIPQSGVIFNILDKNMKKLTIGGESEFKTDSKGVVTLKEKVLPGIYYIKEIKAPSGYYLDPNGKEIKIEIFEKDTKVIIKEIKNTPQKGRLVLEKKANLLVDTKANEKDKSITDLVYKDGFLANTKWELRAKEDIKSLDGVTLLYKKGDLVENLITNSTSEVSSKELPLGKYTLKEVSAPKEYLVDPKTYDIEFTSQSQEVRVSSKSVKAYNERKELTFEFSKTFEDTKLFTIEPKATFGLFLNEDYKENGVTIKKDTLLDKVTIDVNNITEKVTQKEVNATKEVKEDVISYEISTFTQKEVENKDKPIFSKDKENPEVVGYETKVERTLDKVFKFNTLEEKDKKIAELEQQKIIYSVKEFKTTVTRQVEDTENKVLGKIIERTAKGKFKNILIDGKFYIKEISTAKGYVLDSTKHETGFDFKTTDKKENTVIGANIVNKLNRITLDVTKIEAGSVQEGNKKVVSGAEYVLIATDSKKGETIVGKYITDENGKIIVENLPNGNYIFKETQSPDGYFKNEEEINLNITDKKDGSTYKVEVENEKIPEIKTNATDKETGKKTVNPFNIIQIKDIVKYKDLIIGKEYNVKGVLMDKETNKPILDKKGKEVRAEITFIPKKRNGEVELIFTINADILRGKTTVVFEDLYKDGKLLVSHNDINDKDQTVKISNPEIKTKFTDIKGDKTISGNYKIRLVDNVEYKDLIIGNEYEVKMRVAIKGTNPIEFIKDENGNDLVVIKKFIADKKDGIIQIEVDLDLSTLKGKEIVAFEKIYKNGKLIATHEDINDKDQTIQIQAPAMPLTGSLKQHTNLVIGGLLLACGLIVLNRKKLIQKNSLEEE